MQTEVEADEHVETPVPLPVFGLSAPHLVRKMGKNLKKLFLIIQVKTGLEAESPTLEMEAESPQTQAGQHAEEGQPKQRKSMEPRVCKVCGDSPRSRNYYFMKNIFYVFLSHLLGDCPVRWVLCK